MRVAIDTEFTEYGWDIDLVSIALVAEDGREYYAFNREMSLLRVAASPWVMENVWPSIPKIHGDARMYALARANWWPRWLLRRLPGLELAVRTRTLRRIVDWEHPRFRTRSEIAADVRGFLACTPDPQLWADYAAYDHVVMCQLWGSMVALPSEVPMFTCDLQQERARLGGVDLPVQESGLHDALADARHTMKLIRHLDRIARDEEIPS